MNEPLPFLSVHEPDRVFAWRNGQAITARQFYADARALAARLPERGPMLNACDDRYWFAVGLAAAMLRCQLSVLPHNHVPSTLGLLADEFPGIYYLAQTADLLPTLSGMTIDGDHAADDGPCEALAFPAEQPCACLFTSGSTGRPMAYVRTWGVVVAGASAAAARLGTDPDRPMNLLATVPVQHSYGFESSLLLAMVGGGALVAERPFYPVDVAQALAALPRPRALVTTPVHLRAICGLLEAVPSADLILSATAVLDPELAERAERQFHAPLVEIYGATESGQSASRRSVQTRLWEPLAGLRFDVLEGVAGVSGGHVGTRVPLGDLLQIEPDGRFLLLGRTADMVNVAGKRSSITHLDRELLAIPGVRDGAFLIVDPDSDLQRLAAFYVAPELSREQIMTALRGRIEPAFMPRPLIAVESLPRDANGKTPRQRLLAMLAAHDERRRDRP